MLRLRMTPLKNRPIPRGDKILFSPHICLSLLFRDEKDEEVPKSPIGSQGTLKAESSDGSPTPTPSPENPRRSLPLKTLPDESGNCSSLDSTTSRGSSIARLLLMRRQAGSPASTRSSITTQARKCIYFKESVIKG